MTVKGLLGPGLVAEALPLLLLVQSQQKLGQQVAVAAGPGLLEVGFGPCPRKPPGPHVP